MVSNRHHPKYNKLRRLPWWQRRAARASIDAGEGLFGSAFITTYDGPQKPKDDPDESPTDDNGEWKAYVVPEPVRRITAAFERLKLPQEGVNLKRAKKAYHKAAFKSHPDQGGSSEDFKNVKEAYDMVVKHIKES